MTADTSAIGSAKYTPSILLSINKKIIEWSLENIQGRIVSEDILKREESKVQVVSTEYIGDLDDLDDPILLSQKIEKLLNRLTKEQMEQFEKDVQEGKDVTLKDYLVETEVDYTNKLTDTTVKISNTVNLSGDISIFSTSLLLILATNSEYETCRSGLLTTWFNTTRVIEIITNQYTNVLIPFFQNIVLPYLYMPKI